MISPIRTRIKNISNEPFTVYWAGPFAIFIPAHDERIVEGEPWSIGDQAQKDRVINADCSGKFELTLLVLQENGEYMEVPYAPRKAKVVYVQPVATSKPAEQKKEEPIKKPEPIKMKEHDFNVIATTNESREVLKKLGARPASEIEDNFKPDSKELVPDKSEEPAAEPAAEEAPAAEAPVEETKPAKKTRSKK